MSFHREVVTATWLAGGNMNQKSEVFCEVCLEEFGGDENGLTFCCNICGRCGFCEHCVDHKNHDCLENTSEIVEKGISPR